MSIDNLNAEHRGQINVLPPSLIPRRRQCCSFCHEPGHNITRCDDNRIREFELLCATQVVTMTHQHEFKNWLREQDEYMVKVYAIRKFRVSFSATTLYRINMITNFIYRTYVYNLDPERIEREEFENDIMGFIEELTTVTHEELQENRRISEIQQFRAMENMLMREMFISMMSGLISRTLRNDYNKFKIESIVNNNEDENTNNKCECNICYDDKELHQFVKLGCNHEFCKDCVINTMKSNDKNKLCCAFCRTEVTKIESRTDEVKNEIDNYIE